MCGLWELPVSEPSPKRLSLLLPYTLTLGHRVYKMMGLKALLGADGALELSGDVIAFPKNGISLS
jgi:hypothetical protein